jgi:uncharacterized repeat protein (TIGR03803 family)
MVRMLLLTLSLVLGWASSANADMLEVLHTFTGANGQNPISGLTMDAEGNLYGVTTDGGANKSGVAFQLKPNASKTAWTQTILHHFCSQGTWPNCTDGWLPYSNLLMDVAGNLYGITWRGGTADAGVVFRLTPNATKTAWTQTVLHSFCSQANCADGASPLSIIMDATEEIYGIAPGGSAGVVFRLTPNQSKTVWTHEVLHSFCAQANCADGAHPRSLIIDAVGTLYGATVGGGTGNGGFDPNDGGTVFQLTPNQSKTAWTHNVLYSFCSEANCTDGGYPNEGLIMDAEGNLYGTTGGSGSFLGAFTGVVFKLTPNASRTAWTQSVLYSFCPQGDWSECNDGFFPRSLIADAGGNLYGTTYYGGNYRPKEANGSWGRGTLFQLTPNASGTAWTHTILHAFCSDSPNHRCLDGRLPTTGLIKDAAGKLYGTTWSGGTENLYGKKLRLRGGTVFVLTPN